MQTMDIFVVYKWEHSEGSENIGFYRKQSDAEYIRDHCIALEVKSFVESYPVGSRDDAIRRCHWLDIIVGFGISEEEVYL